MSVGALRSVSTVSEGLDHVGQAQVLSIDLLGDGVVAAPERPDQAASIVW
jgi:hypothetical protein